MRHVADTLRTLLEANVDAASHPSFSLVSPALETIAKRTRMRVRLLDRRGHVVSDSHAKGAPEGPEAVPRLFGESWKPRRRHRANQPSTDPGPLDDRVEIRAARRGQLGTATRYHQRIKRVFLFLAMPVMTQRRVVGVVYITRSTIPVLDAMYRLRSTLLIILAIALALTGLLSIFLATTISRPLTRLARAAKRLSAGERDVSLRLERRDEIGELSRAFAALLQKLDDRARYVAEFAANISHEFKTPLASMRGAAELLADADEMNEATRARFLGNILADVQRLDRLVSRILELSRIEATLETRKTFDLGNLIHHVVDSFADDRIVIEAPSKPLGVHASRAHLASALTALIENALQHSDPPSPVRISVRSAGDPNVVIQIVDTGEGISPANQKRVFDRFFSTHGGHGSTGIGLAIVAAVAAGHGGQTRVESEPGQGSVFTLDLPILVLPTA
ncbi:MAG: HAMP domain-containing protein [Deltaproteobacteria bacterium]|nr:HAMP domain-containing protein [Deltaproteobacteria bacterium]